MKSIGKRYSDIVRKLFLICGLVLLITLPFLRTTIPSGISYPIILILALTFFAGMTSPKQKHIIIGDIFVSVLGFAIFMYQATSKFTTFFDLFFITNFSLAILFLFAFYWSLKTIRSLNSSATSNNTEEENTDIEEAEPAQEEIINASENSPVPNIKHIPTEEERRKMRFLREEE